MPDVSIDERAAKNLLTIIAAYRKATRESLQLCSKKFYGDAYFFDRLKAGKASPTFKTTDKILEKIRAVWPAKAVWPMVPVIQMDLRPMKK